LLFSLFHKQRCLGFPLPVIGFLYAGLAAAPAAAWGSALTVESPGKMRNRVVAERA